PCLPFSLTDPSPPLTYTLSLHDALPIYSKSATARYALEPSANAWNRFSFLLVCVACAFRRCPGIKIARRISSQYLGRSVGLGLQDRKSTRLNSSHVSISYAVFCLKKKII